MFKRAIVIAAALGTGLLAQAPRAIDPVVEGSELKWFSLLETRQDVRRLLGPPKEIAQFGVGFESWQYQIGVSDEDEFSHVLIFRGDELIGVTRNYEEERAVDSWFPGAAVHSYPDTQHPQVALRVRRLSGGRVLLALGKTGEPTSQIVLMRGSELRTFYPWLADRLQN